MRTRAQPLSIAPSPGQRMGSPADGPEVRARRETTRLLSRHQQTIGDFRQQRKSLDEFTKLTETSGYRELMSAIRSAAVELEANPDSVRARTTLEGAANALDVPKVDLKSLVRVPADLVASGSWRPRSVNVDLVDPDDSSKLGPETPFQETLNRISSKILPDTKEVRVPGLYSVYWVADKVVPVVGVAGKVISVPLAAAASEVHGWSDALAGDVQLKLRDIRRATSPSGLAMGDLQKLHEVEQRMMVMTAQALSGMALDAETFVKWARDPKSVQLPKGVRARLERWASSGLNGLSQFLKAAASGVDLITDPDAWRTFAIHLQGGAGLEKFWISARGGVAIMFPTLEQAMREGEAKVQIVSRLNAIDTLFGGVTLTSRGGGLGFRAGPIGAKVSEFEHEVKGGIPGIIGFSVGEDYAYGPVISFGYSPPVGLLNVLPLPVNVRAGGEIKLFHPGLAQLSKPTRKAAEQISVFCDGVHRSVKSAMSWAGKKTEEAPTDGWPAQQRWHLARRAVARGEAARAAAEDRASRLGMIAPEHFVKALGPEGAEALGRDAYAPTQTHGTIREYLSHVMGEIDRLSLQLRQMAERSLKGEKTPRTDAKRVVKELERHTIAFEYVDLLLSRLVALAESNQARPVAAQGSAA